MEQNSRGARKHQRRITEIQSRKQWTIGTRTYNTKQETNDMTETEIGQETEISMDKGTAAREKDRTRITKKEMNTWMTYT